MTTYRVIRDARDGVRLLRMCADGATVEVTPEASLAAHTYWPGSPSRPFDVGSVDEYGGIGRCTLQLALAFVLEVDPELATRLEVARTFAEAHLAGVQLGVGESRDFDAMAVRAFVERATAEAWR